MNQVVSLGQLRHCGVFATLSCSTTPFTPCRSFVRVGNNPDTSAG